MGSDSSYTASTDLRVEGEGKGSERERDRVSKILNTKSSFTWFTAEEDFTFCKFYQTYMLQL